MGGMANEVQREMAMTDTLERELAQVISRHNWDKACGVSDIVLAKGIHDWLRSTSDLLYRMSEGSEHDFDPDEVF